jgi:hypothetical protein
VVQKLPQEAHVAADRPVYLEGLERSRQFASITGTPIHVIDYEKLVENPTGVTSDVAARCGLLLEGEALQVLRNGTNTRGRHQYSLEEFSLEGDELARRFGPHRPPGSAG